MTLDRLVPIALLGSFLLGGGTGHAMSMRTQLTVLAFSEEGGAALVRADVQGPEGGGEHSYEIWGTSAPHRLKVTVSSDFGTGAATPQTVSPVACAAALKSLDQALRKHGFRGVVVHADRCAKRSELVTVDAAHTKDAEGARFRAQGNRLVREGLEVRFHGTEIGLYRDEQALCVLSQPRRQTPTEIAVGGGKGGRLVYVIETTSTGDQGLLGLCGAGPHGKLQLLPTAAK